MKVYVINEVCMECGGEVHAVAFTEEDAEKTLVMLDKLDPGHNSRWHGFSYGEDVPLLLTDEAMGELVAVAMYEMLKGGDDEVVRQGL